jgi:hypothetical protein
MFGDPHSCSAHVETRLEAIELDFERGHLAAFVFVPVLHFLCLRAIIARAWLRDSQDALSSSLHVTTPLLSKSA